MSAKLTADAPFPSFEAPLIGGGTLTVGQAREPFDWQLILVYRGKHCPLCTRYLKELNAAAPEFNKLGVDVLAISTDPESKAKTHMQEVLPDYSVAYGLTLEQARGLGLYLSDPRSPQETDAPFAEPGLFVVNERGTLQIVDLSNAPFVRPDLQALIKGLAFIRNPDNQYPVRGTRA